MKNSPVRSIVASICAVALLLGMIAAWATPAGAAAPAGEAGAQAPLGALTVSASGRHLLRSGTPWLPVGDTAWHLYELSPTDVNAYLDDRAARGFDLIMGPILHIPAGGFAPHGDHTLALPDHAGQRPFRSLDPVVLSEPFWQHIDYIVAAAAARGLYLMPALVWGADVDRLFPPTPAGNALAHSYGRQVGQRYAAWDHIVWIVTGEYHKIAWEVRPRDRMRLNEPELGLIAALAEGLVAGKGAQQLVTVHPDGHRSSSEHWHAAPWLSFNALQAFDSARFAVSGVRADFALTPVKPTLLLEGAYEQNPRQGNHPPNNTPWLIRRQLWGSFLAGSPALIYGAWGVWQFDPGWRTALNLPGRQQLDHAVALLRGLSWWTWVPAPERVVEGQGTLRADTYVSVAEAVDGAWLLAYVPSGGSFVLDIRGLGGDWIRARWYDPRSGAFRAAGALAHQAHARFDPPGGAAEENDWVLLLEAMAP